MLRIQIGWLSPNKAWSEEALFCRISRACALVLFVAVAPFLNYSLMMDHLTLDVQQTKNHSLRAGVVSPTLSFDAQHAKPCTFAELHEAFGPNRRRRQLKKDAMEAIDPSNCWSLADEMVRVPASAVVNRDSMDTLGGGEKGLVYRAVLRLTPGSSSKDVEDDDDSSIRYCAMALKSDRCHVRLEDGQHIHSSCIENGAERSFDSSYLGAEYTGALMWYAQQKLLLQRQQEWREASDDDDFNEYDMSWEDFPKDKKDNTIYSTTMYDAHEFVPGILPTWAIVEDTVFPFPSDTTLRKFPHHDPTVKAVLMPLRSFQPVTELMDEERHSFYNLTSTQLARLMVPAADGLLFVASLGLAFRDVQRKNVGVSEASGDGRHQAFIYDNSFVGFKPLEKCESVACNFCHEPDFPTLDRPLGDGISNTTASTNPVDSTSPSSTSPGEATVTGWGHLTRDMEKFRGVVRQMSRICTDEVRAKRMRHAVHASASAQELREVLLEYAQNEDAR